MSDKIQSVFTTEDDDVPAPLECEGCDIMESTGQKSGRKKAHEGTDPLLSNISSLELNKCAETHERLLGMLFRISLEEGCVPREWRTNVKPISKKDESEVALNYRSVSLTSVVGCKTPGKIITEELLAGKMDNIDSDHIQQMTWASMKNKQQHR